MNNSNYYAKRLKIILACYQIESATNDILKIMKDLDAPENLKFSDLHQYLKGSKVMRIKPYMEKIIGDIREIHN